jgi:NADH:ubiquinone oxidoreductase subunit E
LYIHENFRPVGGISSDEHTEGHMQLLEKLMEIQEAEGAVTDETLRRLSKEMRVPLYRLEGLRGFYPVFRAERTTRTHVRVCRDISCAMRGGEDFCKAVAAALAGHADVEVEQASCLGRCDTAPAATVNEIPVSGSAEEIAAFAAGRTPLPPDEPTPSPRTWPTDPYGGAEDRYAALKRLVAGGENDAGREEVIAILKDSGLRGMGGAGFPTGAKWDFTRRAAGEPKYVVCNADESEPGTFKDRLILEELPHLLIEAIVIGGWVIGANEGIIYLRHEYGRERKALKAAIAAAEKAGAVGESVFGSGFAFDLKVFISPGGYILGEETALLEALEDKRGEPRNKPPFPTNFGLWGKPTLMNNVETFAAVPVILERGAAWWAETWKSPVSIAFRWAPRYATCWSNAAACREEGRWRHLRPGVPPPTSCRETRSTCRWTFRPSRRPAACWAPAP